ncbi:MAG: glycoside hydrolase family 97 protein, partial [Reichenbachiella sp.]
TDSVVLNHYQELKLKLANKDDRWMDLCFRVFDDGVGFRYEIPKQERVDSLVILDEITEFNFAQSAMAWSIPANYESYEFLYRTCSLDSVQSANTPITLRTDDGTYMSIHEANLTNYAGMTLINKGGNNFECDLVPWPDRIKVKAKTSLMSPWRTIMITDHAGELIESHLIQNLNEPSKIHDVSWIKPMKYVGIWWGMHLGAETWTMGQHHGATTENMKRYIDFASSYNIQGVLAEGWNTGWEDWGKLGAFDQTTTYADYNFDEVVAYARQKKVELIGHHETGGDILTYEQRMDTAMQMLSNHGIRVLKTGYAGPIPKGQFHHGQWMVNHYRRVVETAAKYQLMLDVHEPIKATGISRTWPNMMTREGVRGMEWNAWSEGNPPEHHLIIPFTRGLGGPIDYTPGIFDIKYEKRKRYVRWNSNDKGNSRVNTTLAKQMALWVTLYSPLQMASDQIENYEGHPAFKFFENLPVSWNESRVLAAEIGDYLAVARRNDDSWWIGTTTDEKARVLELPLSFLKTGINYQAIIYADDADTDLEENPAAFLIHHDRVNTETILTVKMVAGGGQAIKITPLKE